MSESDREFHDFSKIQPEEIPYQFEYYDPIWNCKIPRQEQRTKLPKETKTLTFGD